ncbi:MAG: lactate utilization protein [Armatimonadetes bacterium]|nr:lactate utilization protein [Armatimonadota bacterium]
MSERDLILGALSRGSGAAHPSAFPGQRCAVSEAELWKQFQQLVEPLGGRMIGTADLEPFLSRPALIDEDAMPFVAGLPWLVAEDPWEAEVGITTADLAVAETGSLLLSAGPGKRRLASLTPWTHICIIESSAIVETLAEAIEKMDSRTSVFVTGASRTADIEGVLVQGVHGPRELLILRT